MQYKLVAIDMDGTLLNEKKQVSKKNRTVIEQLADRGVDFVLASGRPYQSLHPYTEELEVYLPLITANGSIIRCALTDKIYHKCSISLKLAQEIVEYGEKNNYFMSLYYPDQIVTFAEKMAKGHRELEGVEADLVDEHTIDTPPNKIIYHATSEQIKKAFDYLSTQYEDELYITRSEEDYLEIMNLEVSKGQALEHMLDRMNLTAEEAVAIGNNFNDVAMFETAGLAVAMANSPAEVKEKADFITKSNDQDGVAYALKKIFLSN